MADVTSERVLQIQEQYEEMQRAQLELLARGVPPGETLNIAVKFWSALSPEEQRAHWEAFRLKIERGFRQSMGDEAYELSNEIDAANRAVQEDKGSDRSAAIVKGAATERWVTLAIERYFDRSKPSVAAGLDRLFDSSNNGALGNFGAKVDMGMALGIYGEDAHRALKNIGHARNVFAHRLAVKTFDDDDVPKYVDKLRPFLMAACDFAEPSTVTVRIRSARNETITGWGYRVESGPFSSRRSLYEVTCAYLGQLLMQARPGMPEPDLHGLARS